MSLVQLEIIVSPAIWFCVFLCGIEKNSMNSTGGMSQGMIESPEMQSSA
jgi:hypothetical protein